MILKYLFFYSLFLVMTILTTILKKFFKKVMPKNIELTQYFNNTFIFILMIHFANLLNL